MKKYFTSYWIRSAFFTFLQRFSLTFFGFVNFIILIRTLSKSQMGVWAFFLVVTTIVESTKLQLLKNAHIKFVEGGEATDKVEIASSSLLLNIIISLLFILALFAFSGMLSSWLNMGKELETMLKWFVPGMIGLVFFSHMEAVSQSHFDFQSVFAGYFSRQVLFFVIIALHQFLKVPFTLVDLAIYQSISIALGALVLYFFGRRHLRYHFNPTLNASKRILGFGGYIFGIGILSNIFANIDQLMIAKFTSSKGLVASYNAAKRITALVEIPSYAAAEILLPKVSQVNVKDGASRIKYMYERMVGILLSLNIPIAIFIIIFPHFVINLIAGKQYADASFILQMYMISGIIRPIQNQAANMLLYIGKSKLCFILNFFYVSLNILINYLCFMQFGIYGAAIGNVIICVLGTIVWYSILKKSIGVDLGNVGRYFLESYKTVYQKILLLKRKRKQDYL